MQTLTRKLGLKPGMRALILSGPRGYLGALIPRPAGLRIASAARGSHDFVQVFVRSGAELRKVAPRAVQCVAPGGPLWITYPKKTSDLAGDLGREEVRAVMARLGHHAVTAIAIDETWSGLRFRPRKKMSSPP